ncbi:MAG: hypothetical protein NC411_07565 [Bacteroides sp.]|nr:hypothetical protein [Bacteroides sp.]
MNRYDDIINRKYEGSTSPRRMSMESRAAQFAPFSALSGYETAIDEKAVSEMAKFTSTDIEHSEDQETDL